MIKAVDPSPISPADLYVRVAGAAVADPSMLTALLEDFEGTVAERIGVVLPKPATLVRIGSGFRLTYDGKDYDLGDPRNAIKGELNDAELELVSGGGNCDEGAVELDDRGRVISPGSEGRAR